VPASNVKLLAKRLPPHETAANRAVEPKEDQLNDLVNVDLLNVEQTAKRLGTEVRFVRRLVAERRIRFYKVGKYVRFHPDDVAEFIRNGQVDVVRPVRRYKRGVSAYA
jgi:excisionase family DNA binding protein